jgi:peptidoglycan/xylan/chitin deacetylase (PgdA/CDA1 family)
MKSALFTLSIDDGHPLDLKIAELLKRYDIPATFYIPLHNSEGHPVLQTSALCELAKHFEIGSHTLRS